MIINFKQLRYISGYLIVLIVLKDLKKPIDQGQKSGASEVIKLWVVVVGRN